MQEKIFAIGIYGDQIMKFAIIGGGVAAFEAALAIRSADAAAEIIIYSRETVLPYRRPALSGMVAEALADAQFYMKPAAFYAEKNIVLKLGTAVTAIDRAGKTLQFADGTQSSYDRLLLATGSSCFLPPVPGIGGENVLSLREFADLEKIHRRLEAGVKKIAVIGGGILGLELAESLFNCGCQVTVIEGCPALLPRNLDTESAGIVTAMLGKIENLTLRFGECVKAIHPDSVELANGSIEAELVLVSAGTRANLELAEQAGLPCKRGITTDAFCRTADPDVFAAGDCAEIDGTLYGLYNAAKTMGHTAGINLAGGSERFPAEPYPARLSIFGVKIFSVGTLQGRAETEGDISAGIFQKRFYDEAGKLCGCILIGDLKQSVNLQKQLR